MAAELKQAVRHALLARMAALGCGATLHIVAVRTLGIGAYGHFVLAESIVLALSILALSGSHVSCFTLRRGPQPAPARTVLVAGTALITVLTATMTGLAGALLSALPAPLPAAIPWLLPTAAAVLGLSLYRFFSEMLRLEVGVGLANYFSGRGNGFVSIAAFAAATLVAYASDCRPQRPDHWLWLFAAGQWLGVVFALAFLQPTWRSPDSADASVGSVLREFWKRGPLISLTQEIQIAQSQIDLWLLGALGNPIALGVYGLAKRFAGWLIAPAGLVALSGKRRAVEEFLSAGAVSEPLQQALRHSLRRSWFAVIGIVTAATVVPSGWLHALAGPSAHDSRWLFVALGMGQALRLLFGNGGPILAAAGYERDNLSAHGAGLLVSAGIGITLVPSAGGWAAALAFSGGMVVSSLWVSYACRRRMAFACDPWRWPTARS